MATMAELQAENAALKTENAKLKADAGELQGRYDQLVKDNESEVKRSAQLADTVKKADADLAGVMADNLELVEKLDNATAMGAAQQKRIEELERQPNAKGGARAHLKPHDDDDPKKFQGHDDSKKVPHVFTGEDEKGLQDVIVRLRDEKTRPWAHLPIGERTKHARKAAGLKD